MSSERDARAGVSEDAMLTAPTNAVATASTFSAVTIGARKLAKGSDSSGNMTWPRAIGAVLAFAAVLLIPWTAWLAVRLPSRHVSPHWDIAWVGFDIILTTAIAVTGIALWKRSPMAPFTATVAATLLLVDAWFDIFTSRSGNELDWAIIIAAFVELPLAVLCFWLIRRWVLFRGRSTG
jgi:hypothetical protein